MEAILRGAEESFILGCNHPMWPSLGLIHGSRNSDDIGANWGSIHQTAIECFSRNWQNGRLWLNDPDTVMLAGKQPDNELLVRATTIIASGGLILSGDDLANLPDERLAILRKLLPPSGSAARFDDDTFTVGTIEQPDGRYIAMFNWSEEPANRSVRLPSRCRVVDFWTGEDMGIREGTLDLELPPRSSRLLRCSLVAE
jgi:alpha-galactosidase